MRFISRAAFGRCLLCALALLTLNACSSKPSKPTPEEQAKKLSGVLDSGGYVVPNSGFSGGEHEIWHGDAGQELEVVTLGPSGSGHYPVVVYLPSLGEPAAAGKLWREAWAKAGYVVVSMQPAAIGAALRELQPRAKPGSEANAASPEDEDDLPDDEDKPDETDNKGKDGKQASDKSNTRSNSKLERSSELRYLGHEYFGIDNLKTRLQALYWGLSQLRARAGGQGPYANMDLNKLVLAGYDLGAQTVAAALGENFKEELPRDSLCNPLAAILFSPSIDLAEGNVRKRFAKITLPLLVITGTEDNDPYAISSASVREAIWEYSPPGNKYLLSLEGNVHRLLAGADMGGGLGLDKRRDDGGWFGFNQGGGGSGRLQYGGQGGGEGGGRRGHGGGHGGGGRGKGEREEGERGYKQVAAVLSASAAFLDTVVKSDEFALYWLRDKAETWLDRAGKLKLR